jgi:hypothetical protein
VAVGQRLLEAGVVFRKTLAETHAPVAAPPHPPEIIRRGQDEKNDEQDIVKRAHSDARRLRLNLPKTSAARKGNVSKSSLFNRPDKVTGWLQI